MNAKTTKQPDEFQIDDYLTGIAVKIVYRLPRFTRYDGEQPGRREGAMRHGERFRGFLFALDGKLIHGKHSEEDGLEQLFARSYVATFKHSQEALIALLEDIGLLALFEFGVMGLPKPVRNLLALNEEAAWSVLDGNFVFVRGRQGVHAYRRLPKPNHE